MRRTLWLVIAISPLLMATSCPLVVDVQVEPGATEAEPEFGFSFQRKPLGGVDTLRVFGCPDRELYGIQLDSALQAAPVMWSIVREGAAPASAEPFRLTYGRLPAGYHESAPARPLRPGGCYYMVAQVMEDSAAGIRRSGYAIPGAQVLRLLPDGRMIVGMPIGPFLNSRPFREINRAGVGCRRTYRRARTAADSTAAAGREYEIMGTPLTCEWLYAHWPDVMSGPTATERALLALLGLGATIGALILYNQAEPQE